MSPDVLPAVLVLAVLYIAGYGHGAFMAYTTRTRFDRWAEKVCSKAYTACADAYERGATK